MKKKLVLVFSFVVVLCIGIAIGKFNNTNDVYDEKSEQKQKKNANILSMMLETEVESGNYELTTRESWPTSGYKFNSELSKCENGGELSWDDVNKRILMSGNTSDKCYVYFDKDFIKLSLDNYTFSWNAVDSAVSYQIYSNGELLTTTNDPSTEIYGYYNEPGTYIISVKAIDSSNNILNRSIDFEYVLEATDVKYNGGVNIFKKETLGTYAKKPIYPSSSNNLLFSNVDNTMVVNYLPMEYYLSLVNESKSDSDKITLREGMSVFSFSKNNIGAPADDLVFTLDCNNIDGCVSFYAENMNFEFDNIKVFKDVGSDSIYVTDCGGYQPKPFFLQFRDVGKAPSDWFLVGISVTCLTSNTDVYVYDKKKKKFKRKKIGELSYDDEILCWDFDKGEFAIAKPIWIKKCEQTNNYNLLKFSDGSTLETINQHRIFNVEKGMFTYPMSDDTPIGTTTFNSKGEYVKLVSKEVIEKPIDYFNIMTEYHINLFANDILTSCRLSNMYKVKNMKYECNKKRNNGYDLSKYDERLVNGLRLREQDIEEGKLKTYVDNMLRLMK